MGMPRWSSLVMQDNARAAMVMGHRKILPLEAAELGAVSSIPVPMFRIPSRD